MYIIGTAGHVDHGKSTLIEAITGTHPDRLQEERDREMSIVLGFDSFQLPDGKGVSVVDVPGHRDFIENMLSGIGSIDACLLVIAAVWSVYLLPVVFGDRREASMSSTEEFDRWSHSMAHVQKQSAADLSRREVGDQRRDDPEHQ